MKKFIFILPIISTFLNKSNNTITTRSFDDTVNVGILHSLSGTMAISESTLVDAEIMAIEEINSAGGVSVGVKSYKIELEVVNFASVSPSCNLASQANFSDWLVNARHFLGRL